MTKQYKEKLIEYAKELKEHLDVESGEFRATEFSSFLYRLVGYIEVLKDLKEEND